MTSSNQKGTQQRQGLFSNVLKTAQKVGGTGLDVLNQVAPKTAAKLGVNPQHPISLTAAQQKFITPQYNSPQQLLGQHLPKVSQKLLGKYYPRVSSVATFISPELNDKIVDYCFQQLNQWASSLSREDTLLQQSGAANDPQGSQHLSQSLIQQNKLIALAQGGLSGVTGVWGAILDVPVAMTLALRTIYQTGRAHGFELNTRHQQDVVQYIFKGTDLSLLAEKQTLILAIKGLQSAVSQHDLNYLQQLMGSSNDAALLKSWLTDDNGTLKWQWLNEITSSSLVNKLSPIATASISALYSWKIIEDVGIQAQAVFAGARDYLQKHPQQDLSALQAYLKAKDESNSTKDTTQESMHAPQVFSNPDITNVQVLSKQPHQPVTEQQLDLVVEQGIEQLAEAYVTPHENVPAQQPALSAENNEQVLLNQLDDAEDTVSMNDLDIHQVETQKPS